jgi:hypothetical protein
MAMPMPLHDVSLHEAPASRDDDRGDRGDRGDRATEQPISGTRARRPAAAAAAAPSPRLSPDEEAMQLMMKVVERVEVARSFAKIAAGIFTVTAARATVQLRAVADAKMAETVEREGGLRSQVDKVRKIARAAKDAAVHVATHRPQPPQAPQETAETTSEPTE